MLRGSGIAWDLRKKQPYEVYDARWTSTFRSASNGDCYDRYLVRVEEMRQSNRIVRQCIDWLRKNPGPVMIDRPQDRAADARRDEGRHGIADPSLQARSRKATACRQAEAYAAVEAPRGEFGIYLVSDGANKPYRAQVPRAGLPAPRALDEMVRGHHAGRRRRGDRHAGHRVRGDRPMSEQQSRAQ